MSSVPRMTMPRGIRGYVPVRDYIPRLGKPRSALVPPQIQAVGNQKVSGTSLTSGWKSKGIRYLSSIDIRRRKYLKDAVPLYRFTPSIGPKRDFRFLHPASSDR